MEANDQQNPSNSSAPKNTKNDTDIPPFCRKEKDYYKCLECDYTSYRKSKFIAHYIGIKQIKNDKENRNCIFSHINPRYTGGWSKDLAQNRRKVLKAAIWGLKFWDGNLK